MPPLREKPSNEMAGARPSSLTQGFSRISGELAILQRHVDGEVEDLKRQLELTREELFKERQKRKEQDVLIERLIRCGTIDSDNHLSSSSSRRGLMGNASEVRSLPQNSPMCVKLIRAISSYSLRRMRKPSWKTDEKRVPRATRRKTKQMTRCYWLIHSIIMKKN
jgi:hypothetical protein